MKPASAPRSEEVMTCRICLRKGPSPTYMVPEMLYATREEFKYFQCAGCGCLQHAEIPADLGRYYPTHYYSYQPIGAGGLYRRFKDVLEWKRNRFGLYGKGLIGRFFQAALPESALPKLARLKPTKETRILDVGCGSGRVLYFLGLEGFKHLTGIDPFIPATIEYKNGARVLKQDLMETKGQWDVITFNHSFEHIPDNHAALRKAAELLAPGGWCVIEVPTVSSYMWREYGIYWNGLDSPRHIYLHSLESFELLARAEGLVLRETLYNSQAAQFWASENFRRGITHMVPRSRWEWLTNRLYRSATFPWHYLKAKRLNARREGDCVAFFLQKP